MATLVSKIYSCTAVIARQILKRAEFYPTYCRNYRPCLILKNQGFVYSRAKKLPLESHFIKSWKRAPKFSLWKVLFLASTSVNYQDNIFRPKCWSRWAATFLEAFLFNRIYMCLMNFKPRKSKHSQRTAPTQKPSNCTSRTYKNYDNWK